MNNSSSSYFFKLPDSALCLQQGPARPRHNSNNQPMKLSTLLFVGLTTVLVGPSFVSGSDFDDLVDLISQLEIEAESLSAANGVKDAEIASLQGRIDVYEEGDGCGGGGGDGGWVPALGDSWNYNLETPVRTDIDVDVFLIDMGEKKLLSVFFRVEQGIRTDESIFRISYVPV